MQLVIESYEAMIEELTRCSSEMLEPFERELLRLERESPEMQPFHKIIVARHKHCRLQPYESDFLACLEHEYSTTTGGHIHPIEACLRTKKKHGFELDAVELATERLLVTLDPDYALLRAKQDLRVRRLTRFEQELLIRPAGSRGVPFEIRKAEVGATLVASQ